MKTIVLYGEGKTPTERIILEINKLMRKRRTAARMISDLLHDRNKWMDEAKHRGDIGLKLAEENGKKINRINELYVVSAAKDKKIKELEKEIKELKDELQLINLENANLEGQIETFKYLSELEK